MMVRTGLLSRTRPLGKAHLDDLEAPMSPAVPPAAHTSGVLYVHSCPSAVVPHVEWAVAAELGVRAALP